MKKIGKKVALFALLLVGFSAVNVYAAEACDSNLQSIVGVVKTVLSVMQIGIPIILLLFGTIDLGKAVMAGDEKEIKAATSTLVKRAIAAVAVFLLFLVISTVTGWVGGTEWKDCWKSAKAGQAIDIGL